MTIHPGGLTTETTPRSAIDSWGQYENVEAQVARVRARFACYVCGAVPELVDASTLGATEPEYIAGRWPAPAVGHEHATAPPTPEALAAAGHAALRRILEA